LRTKGSRLVVAGVSFSSRIGTSKKKNRIAYSESAHDMKTSGSPDLCVRRLLSKSHLRPLVALLVLVMGVILPLTPAESIDYGMKPIDVTFTTTVTSTNTTVLNATTSTLVFVQTFTRHNYTRAVSLNINVSFGGANSTILRLLPSAPLVSLAPGIFDAAIFSILIVPVILALSKVKILKKGIVVETHDIARYVALAVGFILVILSPLMPFLFSLMREHGGEGLSALFTPGYDSLREALATALTTVSIFSSIVVAVTILSFEKKRSHTSRLLGIWTLAIVSTAILYSLYLSLVRPLTGTAPSLFQIYVMVGLMPLGLGFAMFTIASVLWE